MITFPEPEEQTWKRGGRLGKGKDERDSEKAQKEKEDAKRAKEIGATL